MGIDSIDESSVTDFMNCGIEPDLCEDIYLFGEEKMQKAAQFFAYPSSC